MKQLAAVLLLSMFATPVFAQNANIPPQQVAARLYQQCMATADQNFAQQQKSFCTCTSQKIAGQVSSEEIAGLASRAGQGASQTDIGNAIMDDPRFIQIISHCFSTSLGQQGAPSVPVTPHNLPSTPSGVVGKRFGE